MLGVLYVFLWVNENEDEGEGLWYDLGKRVNQGQDYQRYETRNKTYEITITTHVSSACARLLAALLLGLGAGGDGVSVDMAKEKEFIFMLFMYMPSLHSSSHIYTYPH